MALRRVSGVPHGPLTLGSSLQAVTPAHLSDQEKPNQVAYDSNGEDEELSSPALPELPGEHVHGGCHQALYTDKLRARREVWVKEATCPWAFPSMALPRAPLTPLTHADAQECRDGAKDRNGEWPGVKPACPWPHLYNRRPQQ